MRRIFSVAVQEAVNFTVGEFKEPLAVIAGDGSQVPRMTSWTGIRFVLAEVRKTAAWVYRDLPLIKHSAFIFSGQKFLLTEVRKTAAWVYRELPLKRYSAFIFSSERFVLAEVRKTAAWVCQELPPTKIQHSFLMGIYSSCLKWERQLLGCVKNCHPESILSTSLCEDCFVMNWWNNNNNDSHF